MSRSFIGRLFIAAPAGIIGALTFVVPPALAGNLPQLQGTPGDATATAAALTPTAGTPGTGTAATAAYLPTNLLIYLVIILFLFGLILIAGLLYYVYKIQLKYYSITQSLSQIGVGVKAVAISLYVPVAGAAPIEKLTIDGPGLLAVGAHADFTAKKENNGSSVGDVKWKVDPDGDASWSPNTGAKIFVLALKKGPFVLTASPDTPEAVSVSVAAVDPQATSEDLPFIGQGFGSLVIAVLVVAVILLALTGTLNGEAVATLFGGLLGYIFGVATSTAAKSSKTSMASHRETVADVVLQIIKGQRRPVGVAKKSAKEPVYQQLVLALNKYQMPMSEGKFD